MHEPKRVNQSSLRMRTMFAFAAACLSACALASCATQTSWIARTPVGASAVLADRYPDRVVPFSDGVEGRADLTYATIPGFRPLTLDLYSPPARRTGAFPLVVFVHGGAWMGGHARHSGALENFPAVLAALSARGYVVASINYRLSDEARFPAPVQDVRQAIRWLRENSAAHRIDTSRVIVWGASAGGHLAALNALGCEEQQFDPFSPGNPADPAVDDCVQGLVLWYAPSNFELLAAGQGEGAQTPDARLLGCALRACPVDLLRLASPSFHASADDPPVLLLHGRDDETVAFAQSMDLAARLRAVGVAVELAPFEGAGHSFIAANADATRVTTLAALERTIEFIERIATAEAADSAGDD